MKSDQQLKQDVIDELAWDPVVNETEIGVAVRDGIVTLSGHLQSYAEKYAAERVVQRLAGVKGLAVELDVVLPGVYQRTDAEIAAVAQKGLSWNALLPKDRIKVKVEDGWITLSGDVDRAVQKTLAEKTVRNLLGVVGINNNITVKTVLAPKDVKVKIEAALQRRAHKETRDIEVAVNGQDVTLTGHVDSLEDRRSAVWAALSAPGVTHVVDHLKVA